jgi:hypothetical protein
VADGSATSGGAGDVLLTEDTYVDSLSGTSGIKIGVSKIRRGEGGMGQASVDRGDVSTSNELDVRDGRIARVFERWGFRHWQSLVDIAGQLRTYVTTASKQARSCNVTGVTASTTSVQLIGRTMGRMGLRIVNAPASSGTLYLRYGEQPASIGQGGFTVALTPGAYYESPAWDTEQAVQGIWGASGGYANITESL